MRIRLGVVVALSVSLCSIAGFSTPKPAAASFQITKLADHVGGEPSIARGAKGLLYVTWPGNGMEFFRSSDYGAHWNAGGTADPSSGDDSVNVDQSGAVYQSNLNNNLQADMYKSLDLGATWSKAKGAVTSDASNSPFLVDRPWADAYVPKGMRTDNARVYLQYHDFVPSLVWVNTSTDGGATFGRGVNIVNSTGAIQATACNSMPAGIKVVRSGPHAGRVYAAWLAADVATSVATGCNITQMDTFHTIWIAWSDDEGKTWTDQQVNDAGFGHDAGAFWGNLTLDRKGNPYIAVSHNLAGEWDVYVFGSFDGGSTWTAPIKASVEGGTHFFPAIDAGNPGQVVVAYLGTATKVPQLPYGKPTPGGDPNALWYLYMSETLNLRSPHPSWSETRVTSVPMHVGDVCTLGVFCLPAISDRSMLDFIGVALDSRGYAHIAYVDTNDLNCICVANQVSGTRL